MFKQKLAQEQEEKEELRFVMTRRKWGHLKNGHPENGATALAQLLYHAKFNFVKILDFFVFIWNFRNQFSDLLESKDTRIAELEKDLFNEERENSMEGANFYYYFRLE